MDLLELLRKGGMDGDVDFLREALRGSRPVKWCKSASSCCCCLGGCRLREIGLRKSFVEGQNGGCEVSTSDDPFVVLLSQDGANEAAHGRPVSPNPPKDTDGRREESGRWVRELQGK